jgi:hypothetical protein
MPPCKAKAKLNHAKWQRLAIKGPPTSTGPKRQSLAPRADQRFNLLALDTTKSFRSGFRISDA